MSPDSQDEVNIKLKPIQQAAQEPTQALGSNPQLPSQTSPGTASLGGGTGGVGGISSLQTAAPSSMGAPPPWTSTNPSGLTKSPLQLDTSAPLGSQTDAIYESGAAQLAQAAQQKHLDLLQQLGYMDPSTGQIIPGTLETEAVRQRYELNRQLQEEQRNVDEAAMRGGTVFSGRRAQLQGLRTEPYYQRLANVETDLARQMAEGLQGIGNIQSQFTVDRNVLIAEAAERARQRAIEQQQLAAQAAASAYGGDPRSAGEIQQHATAAATAAANNIPAEPPPIPYYMSAAGPSPYMPVYPNGTYTGGARYATKTENPDIHPIFWFK